MRCVIGGYRKLRHIPECVESIRQHVTGVDEIVIIDDSGDPETSASLAPYGLVVEGGGKGYGNTMRLVCDLMGGPYSMFVEEDFTFIRDVDLNDLVAILDREPYLAQMALMRQPWYDYEADGVVAGLEVCKQRLAKRRMDRTIEYCDGYIRQDLVMTSNPSVWRRDAWLTGWPSVRDSERAFSTQLREQGFTFGWMTDQTVFHNGEHEGHGY